MGNRKPERNKCKYSGCGKNFGTAKQQKIHEYQHNQEAANIQKLYNLDEHGPVDRGK